MALQMHCLRARGYLNTRGIEICTQTPSGDMMISDRGYLLRDSDIRH